MWELDHKKGWAPKNCCFELRCWRRLLRISCTARFKPVNLKGNKPWIFFGRTDAEADLIFLATWCKELTYWKSPWCWERLKTGGEGDDRGWDGWMASPTQWTWVWVNSGSWWWTGRPGVLQSMGSQRVRHDWATEMNWTKQCHNRNSLGTILHATVRTNRANNIVFT